MSKNWLEDLEDRHATRQVDESIAHAKYQLTRSETIRLWELLKTRMTADLAAFQKKHPELIDGIDGPNTGIEAFSSWWKAEKITFPLYGISATVANNRIQVTIRRKPTQDATATFEERSILIKSDFEKESWFEIEGQTVAAVEDVSELLLRPMLEQALNP